MTLLGRFNCFFLHGVNRIKGYDSCHSSRSLGVAPARSTWGLTQYGILPFNLDGDHTFIADILTIIGYAINDNVVIIDRIREYKSLHPKADFRENTNLALNYSTNCEFRDAAVIEPGIGWSWTLKSGNGLLLNIACPVFLTRKMDVVSTYVMPKLSFGIEF